jgi:hypothetical protein
MPRAQIRVETEVVLFHGGAYRVDQVTQNARMIASRAPSFDHLGPCQEVAPYGRHTCPQVYDLKDGTLLAIAVSPRSMVSDMAWYLQPVSRDSVTFL